MSTSGMTLQQLLRLSFASQICWHPAPPRRPIAVSWIALTLEEIGPGDVLLIPAAGLIPKLLEQTRDRGGEAVILWGEAVLEEVTQPSIPLVSIQTEESLRSVHRTLLTILINQRTYLMERGVRIHAQFSQIEAEGAGLNGLAEAMSRISGRGVLLQDKRLQVLAEVPAPMLVSIWPEVSTPLMLKENLPASLHDRKQAGQNLTVLNQQMPGGLERLVTPIVVGGVARGYLSLVAMEGEFDYLDQLVVEQGALVCGVDMARTKAVREAEKRLKGDLLSAVLSGDLAPRDTQLWVQSMGLDLNQSHALLRMAWDGENPPSLRRLETCVNGEVARQKARVILEAVGSEVVCVCQSKETALALGAAVLARAAEEYPQVPARCGIGAPVSDLSQWRDSFRQAGQALEMARRLREHQPLYFPDLSVYRLLLQLEYHPELQAFKQEILGPLFAYEGGGELLRTLEAYFECNGNLSQAAEMLFIHRNTLIYRMERIAEISGLDLDNTETRLAVQLALRIHRMTSRE
jgi:purine catabolism regulator